MRAAYRGFGKSRSVNERSTSPALSPETRITATPARLAPDANATIVDFGASGFM